MSEEKEEETGPSRRGVSIWIKPKDGVDPVALHKKITETVLSKPEYNMKWDDKVKIESGKIYSSFVINEEADFFEEVMDPIEMLYDEGRLHPGKLPVLVVKVF